MVNYSLTISIVREAGLLDFLLVIVLGNLCVFVSRPIEIVTVLRNSARENTHSEKHHGNRRGFRRTKLQQQRQTLDIVEDFACEAKQPLKFQRFRFFPFVAFSKAAHQQSQVQARLKQKVF